MFKKSVLLCSLLILVFSIPSLAALSKSSGAYLEGNIGPTTGIDAAGMINFGYKFNGNTALEGGVAFIGPNYADVVVKGMIPFSNGFELFGKIGPAIQWFDINELEVYAGIGGGYAFTPNLSANIQGIWISGSNYAATVGLNYMF